MLPARIDHARVAETELRVERGAGGDEVAELVAAHDAAEPVGRLDVEVERQRGRGAQLAKAGRRSCRTGCSRSTRRGARARAARRVRRRHHHRDLPDAARAAARRPAASRSSTREARGRRSGSCGCRTRRPARCPRPRSAARGSRAAVPRARRRRQCGRGRRRHSPRAGPTKSETSIPPAAPRPAISRSSDSREQHRAAALRDAVDDDPSRLRRADDLLEHARRPRRSGSRCGSPRRRESAPRRRRRRRRAAAARVPRRPSRRLAPWRCRGSAGAAVLSTRPGAGVGEPPQSVRLDQEGVLGLAAAGDARVPGERVAARSRCRYQRLSRWVGAISNSR